MGFLDKLLGREPLQQERPGGQAADQGYAPQDGPQGGSVQDAPPTGAEDERAIARYRYLLRTAPPEKVEEAHAEAFSRLSPQQRQQVLAQLSTDLPEAERPRSDDPQDLARAATRAEVQQPGFMQRSFGMGGGMGMGGMGMGGMIGGSMLGTIAGVVIGSAVADSLFGGYDQSPEASEAGDTGGDTGTDQGDQAGDQGDTGGTAAQDTGSDADYSGGDPGGSADFGGGDFGGGDFGGGGDF